MVARVLLKSTKHALLSLQHTKKLASLCRNYSHQLTEQQYYIQEFCRKFTDEHLKPHAAQLDKEGRFPWKQIQKLTNLWLMGATVSKEEGGLQLDYLSLALAVEQLSRGCASTGMIVSIHNFLYANLVNERGTKEQKEAFLKEYVRGKIGCFTLSEPVLSLQHTKKLASLCRNYSHQLTEQQYYIQEFCRKFTDEHLKPHAAQLDKEGRFPWKQVRLAEFIKRLQ